jgi:hypothetical protein
VAEFLAVNAARVGERPDLMGALARRLGRAGVNFVDVTGRMEQARAAGAPEQMDLPDGHWNVGSHAAMAEIVAQEIERQGLLAPVR